MGIRRATRGSVAGDVARPSFLDRHHIRPLAARGQHGARAAGRRERALWSARRRLQPERHQQGLQRTDQRAERHIQNGRVPVAGRACVRPLSVST